MRIEAQYMERKDGGTKLRGVCLICTEDDEQIDIDWVLKCIAGPDGMAAVDVETIAPAKTFVPEKEMYLLQNCNAGFVGNSPVFWKEGGCGYTQWIDKAKRWTLEEAQAQIRATHGSHKWQLWKVADIEKVAKRTVDIQDLCKISVDTSAGRE